MIDVAELPGVCLGCGKAPHLCNDFARAFCVRADEVIGRLEKMLERLPA